MAREARERMLRPGWLLLVAAALAAAPLASASAADPPLAEAPAAAAPASEDPLFDEEDDWLDVEEVGDPLEPGNRVVFGINEWIYTRVVDPVADAYEWAVPAPARRSVRRLFGNLEEPAILVNDFFQGRPQQAGSTGLRFVINSTLGIGGLFDPATAWGLEAHRADFGETLGVYGVKDGPYLVVPVLGPSTARDFVGGVIDGLLRPDMWFLALGPLTLMATGDGLATYDLERMQLEELRRSSLDFYAALRSAYHMDRGARVQRARDRRCPEQEELWAIPSPASGLR